MFKGFKSRKAFILFSFACIDYPLLIKHIIEFYLELYFFFLGKNFPHFIHILSSVLQFVQLLQVIKDTLYNVVV